MSEEKKKQQVIAKGEARDGRLRRIEHGTGVRREDSKCVPKVSRGVGLRV